MPCSYLENMGQLKCVKGKPKLSCAWAVSPTCWTSYLSMTKSIEYGQVSLAWVATCKEVSEKLPKTSNSVKTRFPEKKKDDTSGKTQIYSSSANNRILISFNILSCLRILLSTCRRCHDCQERPKKVTLCKFKWIRRTKTKWILIIFLTVRNWLLL